jgi:hypothetical protein
MSVAAWRLYFVVFALFFVGVFLAMEASKSRRAPSCIAGDL